MDLQSQQQQIHVATLAATTTRIATLSTKTTATPASSAANGNRVLPTQVMVTQKSNHVSTVLLCGIPIVSLYIEGQERLCLAQISNTLLKQFSYNEIHNRRVALGITCVQCTPVQLEILRRAGAMPVSSRRCGMITRREAERLCKSFLGDNAPPRLPDDFAFSVHHKCAWGCRGSFLPSRYNSSRAKCIKCTYCGMFFSPNKFIFHSHRISSNDKYVQPDAANFNSWRRHMMLSGQPPEEIVHAWEDVKAMFNGGTRKRLMNSSHSSLSPQHPSSAATPINQVELQGQTSNSSNGPGLMIQNDFNSTSPSSPKRSREVQHSHGHHNIGPVTAAAAVVGATAVAAAVGAVRPLSLNRQPAATVAASTQQSHDLPLMPFSSSFMMDYMWHQAHAAQQQQQKMKSTSTSSSTTSAFSFPNCTLPWIKASCGSTVNGSLLFNTTTQQSSSTSATSSSAHLNENFSYSSALEHSLKDYSETFKPRLLTASAFKPVLQHNQQHTLNAVAAVAAAASASVSPTASLVSSSVLYSSNSLEASKPTATTNETPSTGTSTSNTNATRSSSSASTSLALTVHANLCGTAASPTALLFYPTHRRSVLLQDTSKVPPLHQFIKESQSSDDDDNNADNEDDDDEMVDIETTEEDMTPTTNHNQSTKSSAIAHEKTDVVDTIATESSQLLNRCSSCTDDIDVGGEEHIVVENDAKKGSSTNHHIDHHDEEAHLKPRILRRSKSPASEPHQLHPIHDTTCCAPYHDDVDLSSCSSSSSTLFLAHAKSESNTTSSSIEIVDDANLNSTTNSSNNTFTSAAIWKDFAATERKVPTLSGRSRHGSKKLSSSEKSYTAPVHAKSNLNATPEMETQEEATTNRELTAITTVAITTTTAAQDTAMGSLEAKPSALLDTASTTTGAVLLEALTYCSKNESVNNNNSSNSHNNNNYATTNNNSEFWHVASRLCLQRPLTYDLTNTQQMAPHQTQQQSQQLQRMPLYYRQQQNQLLPPQQQQQVMLDQQQQHQLSNHNHDLLMGKMYSLNNFRYLGHETPARANGFG